MTTPTVAAIADAEQPRSAPPRPPIEPVRAVLLDAHDDVATALVELAAGSAISVSGAGPTCDVRPVERIPAGHKLAVRDLGAGLRIRKYGEPIGRLTADVPAGGWVHEHNLVTSARKDPDQERAWCAKQSAAVHAIGAHAAWGDSPLYDAHSHRLYWVDAGDAPALHSVDLASGAQSRHALDEPIAAITLTETPQLLALRRSGFAHFDPADGRVAPLRDAATAPHDHALAEGRCDPAGRLWWGTLQPASGIAGGTLNVVDRTLDVRRADAGWFAPCGYAWSPDAATMYCADARRGVIFAFDFEVDAGTLDARRVFADVGALPGGPAGASVDAEGCLWSAQFDGGCLVRYDPRGRMDRVIRLPVSRPTACVFGGPHYRQLFVTTASRGLDAAQRTAEPMAGQVLALDVGVAGLPPPAFAASGVAAGPRTGPASKEASR